MKLFLIALATGLGIAIILIGGLIFIYNFDGLNSLISEYISKEDIPRLQIILASFVALLGSLAAVVVAGAAHAASQRSLEFYELQYFDDKVTPIYGIFLDLFDIWEDLTTAFNDLVDNTIQEIGVENYTQFKNTGRPEDLIGDKNDMINNYMSALIKNDVEPILTRYEASINKLLKNPVLQRWVIWRFENLKFVYPKEIAEQINNNPELKQFLENTSNVRLLRDISKLCTTALKNITPGKIVTAKAFRYSYNQKSMSSYFYIAYFLGNFPSSKTEKGSSGWVLLGLYYIYFSLMLRPDAKSMDDFLDKEYKVSKIGREMLVNGSDEFLQSFKLSKVVNSLTQNSELFFYANR